MSIASTEEFIVTNVLSECLNKGSYSRLDATREYKPGWLDRFNHEVASKQVGSAIIRSMSCISLLKPAGEIISLDPDNLSETIIDIFSKELSQKSVKKSRKLIIWACKEFLDWLYFAGPVTYPWGEIERKDDKIVLTVLERPKSKWAEKPVTTTWEKIK